MLWLAVDPGISVGNSVWDDDKYVDGGTDDIWEFADAVWRAVFQPLTGEVIEEDELAHRYIGIEKMVVEDFKIYPWDARRGGLDWDPVRTARLIGALKIIARQGNLEFILQPAKIKERAEAAGAKSLFFTPLVENRHLNDSILHASYHLAMQRGATPIPEMEQDA